MGKGEPVSNKVLEKICNFLGCSANDTLKLYHPVGNLSTEFFSFIKIFFNLI